MSRPMSNEDVEDMEDFRVEMKWDNVKQCFVPKSTHGKAVEVHGDKPIPATITTQEEFDDLLRQETRGSGTKNKDRQARGPDPIDEPLNRQVGGSHYKDYAIQPVEFFMKNNIPYMEGNIIKYLLRWRNKGGLDDLQKAKHYMELMIDAVEKDRY